jgi:hypothetical protein
LDWWQEAKQNVPRPILKGLTSASLLVPWMVWKQHNSYDFEGARPSIRHTMASIKAEAMDWARAGALGLRTILPTTWDVH